MPIALHELVDDFGAAVLAGNGSLFVGAGLSKSAGLPDWNDLLKEPRTRASIPGKLTDAPLVAEYIANSPEVGREGLHAHTLRVIVDGDDGTSKPLHKLLSRIAVAEYWTTNYDQLIERACPHAQLIIKDDRVREISATSSTIIKLHGSINVGPHPRWDAPPVLTRAEFERYEDQHPRMWALLRASYLSRTMLFLGFSFTDPNVEILQRLARRLGTQVSDRHLTVIRRPNPAEDPDGEDLRLHDLKVADLESSGVKVCEIDDFNELEAVLVALVRRTRPPRIFISGSHHEESDPEFSTWCNGVATVLAGEPDWLLASLAGPAGWKVTRAVARVHIAEGRYDPSRLVLHFRAKLDEAAPPLEERLGTAVYSHLDRIPLLDEVFEDCRALLAIRGGSRTLEELEKAAAVGVGVVPLAASGGAAYKYWDQWKHNPPSLGGQAPDPDTWARLNSSDSLTALRAAHTLLRQAMYDKPLYSTAGEVGG